MDILKPKPRKFETGELTVTNEVVDLMEDSDFKNFVYASYIRYCANDWGDLETADKKLNRQHLKHKGNLGGRYVNEEKGWEIWILTTGDRKKTVVTLPTHKSEERTEPND